MRRDRLPAPATLIALLALFVALGGPAQAARLIGGTQIKKNAITSRHVKNRSLTDAAAWFTVTAEGSGPFDSHVGTLALVNTLVAGVAAKVQAPATARLDRIEAAWRDAASLIDR